MTSALLQHGRQQLPERIHVNYQVPPCSNACARTPMSITARGYAIWCPSRILIITCHFNMHMFIACLLPRCCLFSDCQFRGETRMAPGRDSNHKNVKEDRTWRSKTRPNYSTEGVNEVFSEHKTQFVTYTVCLATGKKANVPPFAWFYTKRLMLSLGIDAHDTLVVNNSYRSHM